MTLSLNDLFASPDYHLFSLEGDAAHFLRMDRTAYQRSIFLDGRIQPVDRDLIAVPIAALLRMHAERCGLRPPTGWIFHVAHCGSTLLARALDRPGGLLSLREPMPVRQLAVARNQGGTDWQTQLDLAITMLERRFPDEPGAVVKANVPVNFIARSILAARPDAPAILLHFTLRDYLLAVLRSASHRAWVQRVTEELGHAIRPIVGDLAGLADAECAAGLWLAQMRLYAELIERFPNVHSLDAESFFARPGAVIDAASALFGAPIAPKERDAVLASDVFTHYSKKPGMPFANPDRLARRSALAAQMAGELGRAQIWVEAKIGATTLPDRLGRPLTGIGAPLLGG